ncbi:hypothetical protein AGABI1DRAFT_66797 [Agaricus bisporus var. burnettii JB137-S8]|uniref:Uncharacterized protein n=2 Tax=Agaricus bisporus var. burnettii TaxID=192524 RepID=K5Y6K9_AGABU|nr:uncharacterized protein AGABI1DRAFT_66797 [Agaricus bisporus var. burnettii JB137-S8]EKM83815.1 hypothetical protein AGABI1DRAFT_66797 [Agaricus bisporus var. burnettii JB137-S8]KAF7784382.1 hypothetical protein Agabi119p4_547 [Agaricus bisporus var. burnettii]
MKSRQYCCCAIPLVNAGIYATLIEQFVAGILIGTLSIATPTIVGAATPSFAGWVLAIVCYVAAALQVLGLFGVLQERTILYRRYATLHWMCVSAAFSIAAAWIILSAVRHSTASSRCIQTFFSDTSLSSQGQKLCDIFSWVDVGIMGGLWVLLAILQGYLVVVLFSYGSSQRMDHEQYDGLGDPIHSLTKDTIPMTDRSEPWDPDPSSEPGPTPYQHLRQTSATEVLDEPYQQPSDSLSNDYGYKSSSYYNRQRDNTYNNYPEVQTSQSYDNYNAAPYQNRTGRAEGLM